MLAFPRAILLGLLQGLTEPLPVSSLGHCVFHRARLGWDGEAAAKSASESYPLAFLVGLHVATAFARMLY